MIDETGLRSRDGVGEDLLLADAISARESSEVISGKGLEQF
ncbi:hypothetical protein [Haliangium ochraceum]|nr:hypothetical protein [Haliangium ochraceum]